MEKEGDIAARLILADTELVSGSHERGRLGVLQAEDLGVSQAEDDFCGKAKRSRRGSGFQPGLPRHFDQHLMCLASGRNLAGKIDACALHSFCCLQSEVKPEAIH